MHKENVYFLRRQIVLFALNFSDMLRLSIEFVDRYRGLGFFFFLLASQEGFSTPSLGHLCQCLVTPTGRRKIPMVYSTAGVPVCAHCLQYFPWCPVTIAWLHLPTLPSGIYRHWWALSWAIFFLGWTVSAHSTFITGEMLQSFHHLRALHWTPSTKSVSLVLEELITGHSSADVTSTAEGEMNSLQLLVPLLLMQSRIPLTIPGARVCCWAHTWKPVR